MKQSSFRLLPISLAISAALSTNYAISAESTQQNAEQDVEIIQVRGIRSSLNEAMSIKKDAASIQDSIVAEDLGKFPDQNVAESLQRITGVMIDRTNGEGSKITVRGMGPQFNSVKVNNRTLATTEQGREFDFQSLPSELISGADVIKASRANIAEGSLGAYVNVNTARPLNSPGLHAAGSVTLTDNDLADDMGTKLSAIVSNTFLDDTFGVLLGVSHSKATNRIDAATTNRWGNFFATDHGARDTSGNLIVDRDINNDGQIADGSKNFLAADGSILPNEREIVRHPGRATYSLDTEERERTSLNFTAQWQANEDIVHTFDLLHSDLSRQSDSSGMQIPLQSNGTWEDLVVSDNFTVLEATKRGSKIDGLPIQRGQDSKTLALGLNSTYYLGKWTIETDFAYSKAESDPRVNEMTFHYVNHSDHGNDQTSPFPDPFTNPDAAIQFARDYYAGLTDYKDEQIKGATTDTFTSADGTVVNGDFITVNNHGDILSITDTTIDYTDPAAVRSWWTDIKHNELEDTVKEAKLDAQYELDSGVMQSLDIGIAYTDREKTNNLFQVPQGCFDPNARVGVPNVLTEESLGRALTAEEAKINDFINRNTLETGNTCNDHDLTDSLFSINNSNFLADESGNFPRNFTLINDIEAFKAEMGQIRNQEVGSANDWTTEVARPTASVINTEETLALYAQLNLEGEAEYFGWSGNVGLRYVDTKTSSTGHTKFVQDIVFRSSTVNDGTIVDITYDENQPRTFGTDYSHVLPSANFNFNFNNGFYIKTAAAKVITRPAIEDTGVNRTLPDSTRLDQYITKRQNPELKPYEATQFDLSFEYYEDNGNAYSAGLFYKDISTFVSTQSFKEDSGYAFPDFNGNTQTLFEEYSAPTNRSGGTVEGFELAALHFFDYLPGWLSGFGIQANYTYTKAEDKNSAREEAEAAALAGVTNVQLAGGGLEGFSENAYNLIAFYDNDGFQARLAYNWRDNYLKHRQGPVSGANGMPQHVEDYGQFDFSTSYDINETLTIRAEAINLTNENIIEYADIRERVTLVQYSGRRFQVGVSAKF